MDVAYFLRVRTNFIRFYYDRCVGPFEKIKYQIENSLPPFNAPSSCDELEPPYLDKWIEADTGIQVAGLSCVSLLSESLKLYFWSLQHRIIGFSFGDEDSEKRAFKKGFVAAYLGVLGPILDTDWSERPADLTIIEQVVLARDRGQHGSDLTSLRVSHDGHTLDRYPRPFFLNTHELESWPDQDGTAASWLLMPSLEVTRETLFAAVEQVEKLAAWIETRGDKVTNWRARQR